MLKAVLDTNVFLRALINPHSRCGRLLSDFAEDYVIVLSPAIIREILEVLHRPTLRDKFPQISQLDVTRMISLFAQAEVVEPTSVPSISRDPGDDKFLACARSATADYLVTEDKDLLILESYEGTRICQPAEFIAVLGSDESRIK
jgi:putative PIN family toxin of toxin-antitoxin system